jgi:hypothetical protein
MADDPKPTSNTTSTTTKPKLSKEDAMKRAADMIYSYGASKRGDRPAGTFVSIGGIFTYGTHRDGRKGVLVGKKFLPTSNATTTSTTPKSNATSNTSSSTTTAPTPSSALLKKRGSWAETMRENFPTSFKHGGLVRGAGRAKKGRGRGKMV